MDADEILRSIFSNERIVNFDMFRMGMKHWVCR